VGSTFLAHVIALLERAHTRDAQRPPNRDHRRPLGARQISPPTHAVTVNGSRSSQLQLLSTQTLDGELENRLRRLNGTERYSLILWALPDGIAFADVDLDEYPNDYIQCAGAFDGQMVCEIRDAGRQFALGRDPVEGEVAVDWNGSRTVARPDQVLTGAEVAACLVSYLHTGREPDDFSRTQIEL
jgi:hypothetical protein